MPNAHHEPVLRSPTEGRPPFSCRRSTLAGGVQVAVSGELDLATIARLDRELRRAWATADLIVLDLRELEFIDSSGAHLLVDADRRSRRAGGRLIVVRRPMSEIDCLFALFGLDRVLELVDQPPIDDRRTTYALDPTTSVLQPRRDIWDAGHRRARA